MSRSEVWIVLAKCKTNPVILNLCRLAAGASKAISKNPGDEFYKILVLFPNTRKT
jgi:hypothetical protein